MATQKEDSIPLSLRRKIVLIFDQDVLTPSTVDKAGDEEYERLYKSAYKMAAYVIANVVKKSHDHVFLTCCITEDKYLDPAIVSEIVNNIFSDEEVKIDKKSIVEAHFEKIKNMFVSQGISCSVDILFGPNSDPANFAQIHKAQLVVAQPAEMSAIGKTFYLDWAESMSRAAEVPVLIVRGKDVPETILQTGQLIQTNLEQVGPTQYVFKLSSQHPINHLVVFLLGTQMFPEGYAATVHFQLPDSDFLFLGILTNNKPSSIFKINSGNVLSATLGISIEPIQIVENMMNQNLQVAKPNNTENLATKMLNSLYDYSLSFATKVGWGAVGIGNTAVPPETMVVPAKAIEEWYKMYKNKIKRGDI
ncbi:hypothetical protein BB559_002103 [Furculomyces boomerangus]|uniref:Uncharacterized protein n=1 Tax=Furculomyces boomerangus TaxID=61424 RepID=A0A2T9YY12_9FUNG|nr:hypothetical protein BB559_002103 [Furculomyces boomerangus]